MNSLTILGITYTIESVASVSRDEYLAGKIDHENQKINILETISGDLKRQTLLHEMLHGIFTGFGLHELSNDETLVQSLATALHQCIRDNQELFVIPSSAES